MGWVALRMLTGNRGKFFGIILGVTFAALLIAQQKKFRPKTVVNLDVDRKALDRNVPDGVLAARAAAWAPPAPRYTGGVMAKYAALVGTASEGAVTTGRRMTSSLASR